MNRLAMTALALTLASCPQQTRRDDRSEQARGRAGEHTATTAVALPAMGAPSASASAAPSAGAPTKARVEAPADRQRPPRSGAPGSTRGTIACGEVRCKAPGEICGWDEAKLAWVCQSPKNLGSVENGRYACDDGTDCPDGETCCIEFENQSFGAHTCVPRGNVNSQCVVEICLKDGARCPKGRTCVEGSSNYSTDTAVEGVCVAPRGRATCAGKKRCPAEKPICVSTATGLQCTAEGSDVYKSASGGKRYECTLQSDCNAGETCQASFGEAPDVATFCGSYSMAFRGSLICEPNDPDFCGRNKECLSNWACPHSEGDPPWVGSMQSKN